MPVVVAPFLLYGLNKGCQTARVEVSAASPH